MNKRSKDRVPSAILRVREIGHAESGRMLHVLFDSGASHSLVHERVLPPGCDRLQLENVSNCQTAAGNFQFTEKTRLRDCVFPEFDKSKRVYGTNAMIFNSPCSYDVILGRDFLRDIGLKMDFARNVMEWMGQEVTMKSRDYWHDQQILADLADEDDNEWWDQEANILDAKYEKADPKQIVMSLKHLTLAQQEKLQQVMETFELLFNNELGHYHGEKIHLELEIDAIPVHQKAYSVPKAYEDAFKRELMHLVRIGVLRPCGPTEWAAPSFIIPKKDGRVRWLTDFRALNRWLKRKIYPLPLIHDIVARRKRYKYFTKLDLSMMYYAFELDEESKELCTIVTPFGKYQYCRLAMGLKPSPDIAQYHIEKILDGLDVEVYIDDVGIFSNDYDEHLQMIAKVLTRLQEAGLKVNPEKCEWAVKETDFLGHWLTPDGVKPWKKKVDAVLKMSKPTNITELRSFLGAVTFYRNMWPRRSHILAPLTKLTGSSVFEWSAECQKAFDEMKAMMVHDALCAFPNPNLPFHLYTDASDYQMGAVIIQDGRPVAYWSRKLNDAQKNYSVMEKEMLSIVECLKEFRSMLYGTQLHIYTDHKNLTFRTLNAQRVLRWRMFLEEFSPKFQYCPGKDNVLADCFSRLPRMDKPTEGKKVSTKGKLVAFENLKVPELDDEVYAYEDDVLLPPTEDEINRTMPCRFSCCRDESHEILEDDELIESYLNHPELPVLRNPITMQNIQQNQQQDQRLFQLCHDPTTVWQFPMKRIQNREVICFKPSRDSPEGDWKIALPLALLDPVIVWYHLVLGHCGSTRLYQTIGRRFAVPGLKKRCEEFKCGNCQVNKQLGPGYGHLPPRHAALVPWDEVAVDLIGPWKIKIGNQDVDVNALTCIDPVTNLVEIVRIENKTASNIARHFENCWLARYPRPNKCIHDNGGEFIGADFQVILEKNGIKDAPTTSKNPQANSVCERLHQTVANILRTTLPQDRATSKEEAFKAVDDAIATTIHATRCSVSRSLQCSPGELVFHRDMLLDVPVMADLVTIQERRQKFIDENLRRQNQKRIEFEYKVGGEVLIKSDNPSKLEPRAHGPYVIAAVYTNGTLDVRRNAQVTERLNIRRVIPFRRK